MCEYVAILPPALPAAADTLPHVGAIRKGSRDWTGLIKMTARHFLNSEKLTSKSFAVLRCHKKQKNELCDTIKRKIPRTVGHQKKSFCTPKKERTARTFGDHKKELCRYVAVWCSKLHQRTRWRTCEGVPPRPPAPPKCCRGSVFFIHPRKTLFYRL